VLHVGACWVETTTLTMRTGLPFSYCTETCVLASGAARRLCGFAHAVQFAAERWANMIGAGINSGVSSQANRTSAPGRRALLVRLLALGRAGIDALGDVRALARDQIGDENLVGVKHVVVVDVADVGDGLADDVVDVDLALLVISPPTTTMLLLA
jgi:hypothetical protein